MSQNLFVRKYRPSKGETLPDALKFILRNKWGLTSSPMRIENGDSDVLCFLEGLEAANVNGADELLSMLDGGDVEIWLE